MTPLHLCSLIGFGGWLLLVMLSFKIKSVPLVGVGLSERTPLISHGAQPRQVP